MGWLDWLLGGTSEPISLEARMEAEADREIEDRKRQARDRDIRRKAIDVVREYGKMNNMCSKDEPDHHEYWDYRDDKMNIYYKYTYDCTYIKSDDGVCISSTRRTEGFEVRISFHYDVCYSEEGSQKSGKKRYGFIPCPYGLFGEISTYKPDEWEAHLDELYRKVPQVREERLTREAEEKIKAEQQKVRDEQERKRQELEYKKKRFGL